MHPLGIYAPKNKVFASNNEAHVQMAIGTKNEPFFESKLIQSICPKSILPNVMKKKKQRKTFNIKIHIFIYN